MYSNPYQYPSAYQQAFNNAYNQPLSPHYEVPKVNGKQGAEMFSMSPNSQVLLLDETAPIVWLKTTDSAGFATCKPYKIEPYEEPSVQNNKTLEQRIERLEQLYEQSNINQSQYTTNGNEQFNQSEPNQKPNSYNQKFTESKGNANANRK